MSSEQQAYANGYQDGYAAAKAYYMRQYIGSQERGKVQARLINELWHKENLLNLAIEEQRRIDLGLEPNDICD